MDGRKSQERLQRAADALAANGFAVMRASDTAKAYEGVLGLIPDGSEVHHGASRTLELTGIAEALERSGRFKPLRPRIWAMDRQTQSDEIRRLSAAPDVMLGSVHAVTETGSLMAASMSGSQLGPTCLVRGGSFSSSALRRSWPTWMRAFIASTSMRCSSKTHELRLPTASTAGPTRF